MTLRFNSDGTFRVLQMADIQDGPNVREDTIRLIEAAIKKTHPDLIVFTGDQIRGYDPAYIDTFLRRRGEQPGTRIRAVTEIEAKIRGIKRHPFTKALLEQPPTDDNWMIDGIGTDSPKLVKRNKRDGRNGSANKLESWAQSINRATAATILDSTRQKYETRSQHSLDLHWKRESPLPQPTATTISSAAFSPTNRMTSTESFPVA